MPTPKTRKPTRYVALLRGVNVGGKNILSMAALVKALEQAGYTNVSTFIASGNVLLESDKSAAAIQANIEKLLPKKFTLDSALIKVLVLSARELQQMIDRKPRGFGAHPETYHSDAIFLMGISAKDAIKVFNPRAGVDAVWPGEGIIYSQRLSARRTESRLNKAISTPLYKSMTIRTWRTCVAISKLMREVED